MYKSPKSSGGSSGFLMLILILWGAFYLSGCSDLATSPNFDEFDELVSPKVDLEELELTIDPDIIAAVMADIESELGSNPSAEALNELQVAADLFQAAQVEYSKGNYQQVQELGEEARMALSRALVRERGSDGIEDRIARTENLRARLQAGDTQDFDRPGELADRLGDLVNRANDARRVGDDVRAGARVVEGGQRTDRSRGRKHDGDRSRGHATDVSARLAVAMASNAVQLATRLLEGRDPNERQLQLLEAAARLASSAAEALANGQFRAAAMLGHKAVNTALWAVLAPEVDEDEVRMIKDLAEEMLEAARAALAASPDEALQFLFNRAVASYELGVAKLEEGNLRGVGLIWKAAVVGAVIAG